MSKDPSGPKATFLYPLWSGLPALGERDLNKETKALESGCCELGAGAAPQELGLSREERLQGVGGCFRL